MVAAPRQRLTEYFLEVELTTRRHVVVEGRTDERFLRAWLQDAAPNTTYTITPVENLEVPTAELAVAGLPDGNRGRVLIVAVKAAERGAALRCVVDLDCGQDIAVYDQPTVIWTDFPAIESYAVKASVLEKANLLSFGGRLPSGDQLLSSLAFALRELFAVRVRHPHLEKPKYAAGLAKQAPDLSKFNVASVVPLSIRGDIDGYDRPDVQTDPRSYAYGHDVAELLMVAYGNTLKNQAGIRSIEALEGALRSAVQAEGSFTEEPLFRRLWEWITSTEQSVEAC